MTNDKKIYVALGVLAVLGGTLFALSKSAREDAAKHTPAGAQLPEIKVADADVEKIVKIQIDAPGKGKVTLEKQGDAWRLTAPIAYAASQANVKSLLDNLKQLKVKESIDKTAAAYAQHELDDVKATHVVAWAGADKKVDLYFGKSGSRGQMTRIGGQDGVWVSGGYSAWVYGRELKDWRDKEIAKFEDANAVSVAITNVNGSFAFAKNDDKWSGTFGGKAIAGFDPEKVKEMLRAYKTLAAEDFADEKTDADTGLDKPAATVAITLNGDGGTVKLAVGKTTGATGTSRFARREGSPSAFVIGSWSADWATAAESKFAKADPAKPAAAPAASGDAPKPKKKK